MASTSAADADLEKPPDVPRRIRLGWKQGFGLAFLLAVPVLALCQLLGDRKNTSEVHGNGLVLRAETPVSARYGDAFQLRLMITTPGNPELRRVNVEISADYLAKFREVHTQPAIVRSTDDMSLIVQEVPREGGGAPVVIDLTPEEYGWARGYVRVSSEAGPSVELALRTFIFP